MKPSGLVQTGVVPSGYVDFIIIEIGKDFFGTKNIEDQATGLTDTIE